MSSFPQDGDDDVAYLVSFTPGFRSLSENDNATSPHGSAMLMRGKSATCRLQFP
jgi:hypothetical protein